MGRSARTASGYPDPHRCQRYVNVGLPVHVPSAAVSVWPSCGMPLIVGGEVLLGAAPGAACTIAVATEVALLEPAALLAVTTTRIVMPTSAAPSTYVWLVPPPMSAQAV